MALAAKPSPGQTGWLERGELFDGGFYRGVLRRGLVTGIAATAISALGWSAGPTTRRSMSLAGLVASQLVQAHRWSGGGRGDRFFYGSLGTSWAALAGVVTLPPLQRLFGTTALSPLAWAQILGVSVAADQILGLSTMQPAMLRGKKPIS
jgi:hypothetical protein